ncbi:hypothetical protein RF663_09295 [Aeromonas veronii]|uniref:hypothetical protein n=1 Tax=Aeromonas veronii TaxID=654 RepID=UPI0028535072|nr:hypothetical protein [Aeromonas veronii]MDR5014419.1 hypothetical protein [Aeromonas veronii]
MDIPIDYNKSPSLLRGEGSLSGSDQKMLVSGVRNKRTSNHHPRDSTRARTIMDNKEFVVTRWLALKSNDTSSKQMEKICSELIAANALQENSEQYNIIQNMIRLRSNEEKDQPSTDGAHFNASIPPMRDNLWPSNSTPFNSRDTSGQKCVCPLFKSVHDALTHSAEQPNFIQPERAKLRQELRKNNSLRHSSQARTSPVFANSLATVNSNLISNGHCGLPPQKAKEYVNLLTQNATGDISASAAFASSGFQWWSTAMQAKITGDRCDALVGASMNFAGCLASGVIDNQDYITGKAFHTIDRDLPSPADSSSSPTGRPAFPMP